MASVHAIKIYQKNKFIMFYSWRIYERQKQLRRKKDRRTEDGVRQERTLAKFLATPSNYLNLLNFSINLHLNGMKTMRQNHKLSSSTWNLCFFTRRLHRFALDNEAKKYRIESRPDSRFTARPSPVVLASSSSSCFCRSCLCLSN
jgi:hypothetical protein